VLMIVAKKPVFNRLLKLKSTLRARKDGVCAHLFLWRSPASRFVATSLP